MAEAPTPRPAPPDRPEVDIVGIVDHNEYPLRMRELTSRDVGELRASADATTRDIWAAIYDNDASIDTIAQVVWLSRRQNGEPTLPYERVVFTMSDLMDGRIALRIPESEDAPTPEAEVDSPEA